MFKPALLTIDIGTSSLKSALWDIDGNRLSFASASLSVINDENRH
jgi:sugar (pentulose or hexulose) kinase